MTPVQVGPGDKDDLIEQVVAPYQRGEAVSYERAIAGSGRHQLDVQHWQSLATLRIRLGFMNNVHKPITIRSTAVRLGALRRER